MIVVKKSMMKRIGVAALSLLLIVALAVVLSPGQKTFAEELACGDGVCSPTENSDLCNIDCACVDNGVADPGEGCGCKDVVCENEELSSACGTPAGENNECPFKVLSDGTTHSLSEWYGVCWDACECEGKCEEESVSKPENGSEPPGEPEPPNEPEPYCGDGIVDLGEACDDGNNDPDDGCASCQVVPFCGNDTFEDGEECDGPDLNGSLECGTCNPDCTCTGIIP